MHLPVSLNPCANLLIIMNLVVVYLFEESLHAILLDKHNNYGISCNVHEWYKSYLTHREQFANFNGHNSTSLSVSCGVPQGGIKQ